MRGEDVYKNKRKKPILALLSNLYSELNIISVDASEHSSYPTLHYLLTTSTTNYYSKKFVNYFILRKIFYSR